MFLLINKTKLFNFVEGQLQQLIFRSPVHYLNVRNKHYNTHVILISDIGLANTLGL